MSTVVTDLLPIVVAAAIVPGLMVLVILILQGAHGRAAGAAFVAGAISTRLLQGVLFGLLYQRESDAAKEATPWITSMLLLLLAILLIVGGVRLWLKEEDPDAPPPKWLESIGKIAPGRSLLIGMGAMGLSVKQWVFTIAAVQTIGYASLGTSTSTLVFMAFVLLATLPLMIPVVYALLAPQSAARVLQQWRSWLDNNFQRVKIVVSLGFGLLFLWKGLEGLLG